MRKTTDGSAFCMSETQGIGPHYLTSVSYMGGGSDPRVLTGVTQTWASPHLPKGTRFRITGAWGTGGLHRCGGGNFLYDAVVIQ